MRPQKFWQGTFDAFCGVYCAADIIARHGTAVDGSSQRYEEHARLAFRNLLVELEKLKFLTAKKVALGSGSGFYDHELAGAFNALTPRKRRGLGAKAFSDPSMKSLKASEKRSFVSRGSACAIIQEHAGDHWIAVVGMHKSGGYFCFDPHLSENTSQRKKILWKRGVLIADPELIESI